MDHDEHADTDLGLIVAICRQRVQYHYLVKLLACIEVLDPSDLWGAQGNCNSIGAIVSHMLAHVQMAASLFSDETNQKDLTAIEDYFPNRDVTKEDLVMEVSQCFTRFDEAIIKLEALSKRTASDLSRLLHVVEHVSYHLGQVVQLTRMRTGHEFQFVQNGINEAQLHRMIDLP